MKILVLIIFATVCIASKKPGVEAMYADLRCGDSELTGDTGVLKSHKDFGRENYPNEFSCLWTITVAEDRIIEITFDTMDLEHESEGCLYDSLEVRDGGSNRGKLLDFICGTGIKKPIRSSTNKLYFRFTTDRVSNRRGFMITWKSMKRHDARCGKSQLTDYTGELKSHTDFPKGKYPNKFDCQWTITVGRMRFIEITFVSMDLEYFWDCRYDNLVVFDGGSNTDRQLVKSCGRGVPRPIRSSSTKLHFRFTTDDTINRGGFKILWKSNLRHDAQCGKQQLTGPNGVLKSHRGFPMRKYPNNLACYWIITVANDRAIEITFDTMNVEAESDCMYDCLFLYNMYAGGRNPELLARLCGTRTPTIIRSSTNRLLFIFNTDNIFNRRGFKILWRSIKPPVICASNKFKCKMEKCIDRSLKCNGRNDCGDNSDEEYCNTKCGKKKIPHYGGNSLRIVGGRDARPGSWPWQVQMFDPNGFKCSGTLVNQEWVVTAAHCVVKDQSPSHYTLALGSFIKNGFDSTQKNMKVDKIIIHDNYSKLSIDYDLALMHLTEKVDYSDHISPACIANFTFPVGSTCYTTGWGETYNTGHSNVLKQAYLEIMDKTMCKNIFDYEDRDRITNRMICARDEANNQASCFSDSGGPLVCSNGTGRDKEWFLLGVVSLGNRRCGDANVPGFYASLPSMYKWVIDTMASNSKESCTKIVRKFFESRKPQEEIDNEQIQQAGVGSVFHGPYVHGHNLATVANKLCQNKPENFPRTSG